MAGLQCGPGNVGAHAAAGAGDEPDLLRVQLVSSEGGSGRECVLALRCAWVEPLVLACEMEAPVFLEVAVADHRAQGEAGFGAVQAPSCSGDVEPVADEVAAGSFYYPGGDWPARGQGPVVAQELVLAGQVADAGVGTVALAGGKADGVPAGT